MTFSVKRSSDVDSTVRFAAAVSEDEEQKRQNTAIPSASQTGVFVCGVSGQRTDRHLLMIAKVFDSNLTFLWLC